MYSYEDRVRAVQLYIKYGRSAAATTRELGYPSRKSVGLRAMPRYSETSCQQCSECAVVASVEAGSGH